MFMLYHLLNEAPVTLNGGLLVNQLKEEFILVVEVKRRIFIIQSDLHKLFKVSSIHFY